MGNGLASAQEYRVSKEQLKNYTAIGREIVQLEEEIARLRARLKSPVGQAVTSPPIGGDDHDRVGRLYGMIDELERTYLVRLEELTGLQIKIEAALSQLEGTERLLMRWRYLDGMTWEQTADKMHYSWRQVHNIHAKALARISSLQTS